ncbi:MAG: hypothetical protein Q9160_002561 [Pyrenula sp. 1 TL-2023]
MGDFRSPLHGIPILIKNNIATDDKMTNTAGSYALIGAKVPEDSTMAAKLRKAGAIILGKTNLSQWANFRSSNSSNGWSAYGGQTFGAYVPNQDPSGSSSGSGVSSSLGLALAALGTETSGSILSPSNVNNLVGIKPSVGLTSRYLVIPISEHQDTVGPMARTVKDAAYLLQAIAGPDPNDNYTSAIPNAGTLPDYVSACNFSALAGKRIGVPRNVIGATTATSAPIIAAFNAALTLMSAAGATIIDNTNFTQYAAFQRSNASSIVLDADFVSDLPNLYLSKLASNPNNVTDLASLRAFTQSFGPEDFPDRDTATWDESLSLTGFGNTDPRFTAAYAQNLAFGGPGGVTGALETYNLDALVLPTRNSPGVPAVIGSPVITVPLGAYPANTTTVRTSRGLVSVAPNLPFGISFLGERFSEEVLVGLAYAFEQRTLVRGRVGPYLRPRTELGDVVGGGAKGRRREAKL